ncbi:hypothetical protein COV92_03905 [Candidatus Uhrbacteria bacterium CG11_big_fil_rev_8_21_14_0_20_41_9]|nr:MAG: hypothetical protein COV92_03905 [Candidatus Uhrbacteria bacterium CG11_big_fil_rev_8_21_14_0_20_41_9]
MLMKLIGQAIFAIAMIQILPADAAYLEWIAGAGSFESAQFSGQELSIPTNFLPIAEERVERDFPVKIDTDSYGIVTTAHSALVVDSASGMVLLAKHPNDVRPIGSVTKLMSALVFLDTEPDLTRLVSLDPSLDLVTGGRIYLAFYDPLKLEDVLAASLVGSDNTATESLARFSGMSKEVFVQKMNEKAKDFGMNSTIFTDPTGIDATNTSTATDLIKLLETAETKLILKKYMTSESIQIVQNSGQVITIENTDKLLASYLNEGSYKIVGGKTGYLPQAGYVLVTTIDREGDAVHVVVMGAESKDARVNEAKGLAAWAFKVFSWPQKP